MATQTGDLEGLEALLAYDVGLHGDGGGKVRAIVNPIFGRHRVAQTLLGWMRLPTPSMVRRSDWST
jgi:hypothetical protein